MKNYKHCFWFRTYPDYTDDEQKKLHEFTLDVIERSTKRNKVRMAEVYKKRYVENKTLKQVGSEIKNLTTGKVGVTIGVVTTTLYHVKMVVAYR